MARDPVAGGVLDELRRLFAAQFDSVGAARVEVAAGRRIRRARDLAFQYVGLFADLRIGNRHRLQQGRSVRVLGIAEQFLGLGQLDHLADVHDRHAVGDVADDAEVVRDEEVREAELFLEVGEEVDDLGLDGHVEGRDGLVGDDKPRVQGQRPGDADALALAAAEGVREASHVLGPQSHQAKQLGHALGTDPHAPLAVNEERLADDVQEGHARVQRRERILEDHLHVLAELAQGAFADRPDVEDLSVLGAVEYLPAAGVDGAHDAARCRRLPATALPHQAERLALLDGEAHVVHRSDVSDYSLQEAPSDGKVLPEILDVQQIAPLGYETVGLVDGLLSHLCLPLPGNDEGNS